MDFEFYNIRCILNKISGEKNPIYFSYDKTFNEKESRKLLAKIMNQLPYSIEELSNVRAMIKFKFET